MNFSAWSIHRPLPAILLFVLMIGAGLYAFRALPIADFADVEFPMVTVSVGYAGATPTQLETEVTRKVEDSVANITGVQHITSTITDGSSSTMIEFDLDSDTTVALNDVRDAVARIRAQLPQDISDPVISRITTAGTPVVTYALQSDSLGLAELSWLIDDTLTKSLRALPGVGTVTRIGGVDREVRVNLKPDRLLAFGITAGGVSQQLLRIQAEQPGGRSTLGGSEQAIRTMATVASPEDLKAFPIVLSDGRRVRLDELAEVVDAYAEQRQLALLDGKPAVAFRISRIRKQSEIGVGEAVAAAVEEFKATHPTIKVTEVASSLPVVQRTYDSSMTMLYEGALLSFVVVWLFLRDWRATWISSLALPLSVIPTFFVMWLMDITLNGLTMLALSLVVGILVDDAIVEVENIVRHLRDGKTPKQAALEAAQEIGLAVIGTTLTLVAVFLPVAFMPGIPGRFFQQFSITAVTAVTFSLVVARLITPMVCAYKLKAVPAATHHESSPMLDRYLGMVDWTLTNRLKTVVVAGAVFAVSIVAAMGLPTGLIAPDDRGETSISIELPPGSSLNDTRAVAAQVEQIMLGQPEVTRVFTAIGAGGGGGGGPTGGGGGGGSVRTASLSIKLTPLEDRDRTQQEFQRAMQPLLATVPGARISFGAGGFGEGLSVVLSGEDPELLKATADRVEAELRTIPGLGSITSSAALLRPEIAIRPDFERAAQLGATTDSIADAIRIGTTGDVDFRLAKLNLPARQIPIRVQIDEAARNSVDLLRLLRVPARGGTVPLESVASIELSSGPAEINRYDRYRNVTLQFSLNGQMLGDVQGQIDSLPSLQQLPPGVHRQESGDSEVFRQLFTGFALAMVAGVFCVYAVLALLFNDLLQPITILCALPLSVGGAVAGLAITGFGLSLPSLIGILMLMGIAVKNSILLVDYAVMAEAQGMTRREALLDACSKRARPIVMTSIAMGAGMLPVALNLSKSGSFRSPMGVAVLGGLITSTVLSLLVIPAVYTYISDLEAWIRRRRHREDMVQAPANT